MHPEHKWETSWDPGRASPRGQGLTYLEGSSDVSFGSIAECCYLHIYGGGR